MGTPYSIPVVGRYRRQRDDARTEVQRLSRLLNAENARAGGVLAEFDGLRLLLDPQSLVDGHVLRKGGWEAALIGWMRAAAATFAGDPRRKLFLDVGAHWGLYALSMRQMGLFDEIHCFEPEPHNHAQLCAQLFLNHASYDITVHKLAVLDTARAVRIERSTTTPHNRGQAAITEAEGVAVEAATLDGLFPVAGAIIFIKLDIEGNEAAALRGMKTLLAQNDVYLQLESFNGITPELAAAIPSRLVQRRHARPDYVFSTFALPE